MLTTVAQNVRQNWQVSKSILDKLEIQWQQKDMKKYNQNLDYSK